MTETEKMLAGKLYDPVDETLVCLRAEARRLCKAYNDCDPMDGDRQEALLRALINRVPSLRLEEAAHLIEVCATCPAGGAIRAFIEDTYHVRSGGICLLKGFAYRVVPCMKNCKNGPSVRFDGVLYPAATVDKVKALIEGIRK